MPKRLLPCLVLVSACATADPAVPPDDNEPGGGELPASLALELPKNSGDGMEGPKNSEMPRPLIVLVTNNGQPAAGVWVQWEAVLPGARMFPTSSMSDAYGYASSTYHSGPVVGWQYAKAKLGQDEEYFQLKALGGPPTTLTWNTIPDSVPVGNVAALSVRVLDRDGDPVEHAPVSWVLTGAQVTEDTRFTVTNIEGWSHYRITFSNPGETAQVTASLPNFAGIPAGRFQVRSF